MERLAAVSVDLDEIPCYAEIHGLEQAPARAAHAVYEIAVPRFAEWFHDLGIPATFFAIGHDAEREDNIRCLRKLHDAGHEIANHSHHHFYDLTRKDRDVVRAEVQGGIDAIERAVGERPRGFRAPGYTVTGELLSVLEELGVDYDSSVFPCPAYFAAKSAAIATIAVRGRKSRSVVDDPRVLTASADPYRTGMPYWSKGDGVLELPVGVTRDMTGRLPFIGTSVVLAGKLGAALLARLSAGRPLVNLELHGIDLLDANRDGLEFLSPYQPDMRKTLAQKRTALTSAVEELRLAGYRFVTLAEAADRFRS